MKKIISIILTFIITISLFPITAQAEEIEYIDIFDPTVFKLEFDEGEYAPYLPKDMTKAQLESLIGGGTNADNIWNHHQSIDPTSDYPNQKNYLECSICHKTYDIDIDTWIDKGWKEAWKDIINDKDHTCPRSTIKYRNWNIWQNDEEDKKQRDLMDKNDAKSLMPDGITINGAFYPKRIYYLGNYNNRTYDEKDPNGYHIILTWLTSYNFHTYYNTTNRGGQAYFTYSYKYSTNIFTGAANEDQPLNNFNDTNKLAGQDNNYAIFAYPVSVGSAYKGTAHYTMNVADYYIEQNNPTPSPVPTEIPTSTTTPSPTKQPTTSPTVKPTTKPAASPTVVPTVSPESKASKDNKTTFSIKNKKTIKKTAKIKVKDKDKIKNITLNGKTVKIKKNKTSIIVKLKSYKKKLKKKGKWNTLKVTDNKGNIATLKFKTK